MNGVIHLVYIDLLVGVSWMVDNSLLMWNLKCNN
jgi:hypothetical protein